MTKQLSPEKIFKKGHDFLSSKILLTAIGFGLFTKLGEKAMTAAELGKELGLQHPRGTYDFFDCLLALGFLERDGDGTEAKYKNTPETKAFLDKNSPTYIGGIFEMFNSRIYRFFDHLAEALKTGMRQSENNDDEKSFFEEVYANKDKTKAFLYAMNDLQSANFTRLATQFDFSRYKTISDIGGALASLSVILAKHHPHLTLTSIDLPAVNPFAIEYVNKAGLSDRITLSAQDFWKDPFPKAEVITMCNILHNWNLEKKKILIKKAYDTLPEGGALIAVENAIDDARRKNVDGLIMSLIMLVELGDAFDYTAADYNQWCTEAGFKKFEKLSLDGPTSALIAYK